MSFEMSTRAPQGTVPLLLRAAARLAAAMARPLTRLPPRHLERFLACIRAGSVPATYAQALAAHDAVVAASAYCAGISQCLPRSIAICLLCRLRGTWPTWRVGVRSGPLRVHAWVEADGRPVQEIADIDRYSPLMWVPPAGKPAEPRMG
jgi:Transglutaminase-like superfamily